MWGRRKIRLVKNEDYASIASVYQYEMLNCLNEALASNGVEKQIRKKVMQDFAFDFGILHDQGEISIAGTQERPSRQFWPTITFRDGDELHTMSNGFQFHEIAFSNVDEAIKVSVSQLVSLFHRNKRVQ